MLATATLLELARDSAAATEATSFIATTTNAPQIHTISVHYESTSIILRKSRRG